MWCAKLRKRFLLILTLLSLMSFAGRCVIVDNVGIATIEPEVSPTSVEDSASPAFQIGLGYEGVIVPRKVVHLAFHSGGQVTEVLVAQGETVQPGKTLVRLDTTYLEFALQKAQADLTIAEANLAILQAGANAQDLIVAEQDLAAAQADLEGAIAQRTASQAEISYAQAGVLVAEARVTAATEVKVAQAQVTQAESLVLQASAVLSQTTAAVEAAAARVIRAQAVVERLEAEPTSDEIARAEAAVTQAQVAVAEAQATLEQAVPVTPFAGAVAEILVQPGEFASAGQEFAILATLDDLVAEVEFDEWSIVSLAVNQSTSVRILALDNIIVPGQVLSISPLPTFKPGGETVYTVRIALEVPSEQPLAWGMTVEAIVQP